MQHEAAELGAIFDAAGVRGYLHAVDLESGRTIGLEPDAPVVAASVFKIPVLVELVRRFDAGDPDPTERVRVGTHDRVLGSTGFSVFSDPVELSWRDLATSMMTVSDNTATDVIIARLGLDRINATVRSLGLDRTVLLGDCRAILGSFEEDVGGDPASWPSAPAERLAHWRSLDPARTTRTTARDMTMLLAEIWRDEAASPDACAQARRIMRAQVWPHRLRSGFGDEVGIGAKTGTLPGIRNESGILEFPDGRRIAVAIFTRSQRYRLYDPPVDAAIGAAAALAARLLAVR